MKNNRFTCLGLTGGIASGKSAAAAVFADLGCGVVDADLAARKVIEPGTPGIAQIVEQFGKGVIGADGSPDRDALRRIAFNNPDARQKLEDIIHPLVYEYIQKELEIFRQKRATAGVVEAALLLENPPPWALDAVIAVVCGKDLQRRRLIARSGWSAAEIDGVLAAQIDDDTRRKKSDYILENAGTLRELDLKVRDLFKRILANVCIHI